MNDLTTPSEPPYRGSSEQSRLANELAKMLGLVAPITMSEDQSTAWLASAVDALDGIRADEVRNVSLEVRRSVTRPSQIIPEIAKLVDARRAENRRLNAQERDCSVELLPSRRHISNRNRANFVAADWAELNLWLEQMGSPVRYSHDGVKIEQNQ